MAASGTLYAYPDNFRTNTILVAAGYSGAQLNVVGDPDTFTSAEFLKKFPAGTVPAYEGSDGTCLFESNAIAYYVANDTLRCSGQVRDAAYVQQWVNFADNDILPSACSWVYPTLGIMQFNKQNTERAKEDIKKALNVLNEHLKTRTFLVGERVTLADITVASTLALPYQQVFDPSFRQGYVHVNRWFNTLVNQAQFKAVFGQVKMAQKMAQFDSKKFGEIQGGPAKKEKKKDEKKKEQPKQEKEKPTAAAGDAEDDMPKEPKKKDPFAHLPKSEWNMDEFKRTYSNADTDTVALPYFWKNFDPEGYSIWYSEYKFPDELTQVFMSCNLINGMFQRLDRLRKNAFASACLFGTDNNSTISGIWFWRGQDLVFELSEDWQIDYASYNWKKLDPQSEETKMLVKEYFCWEGEFGGKKFNQGKIFK